MTREPDSAPSALLDVSVDHVKMYVADTQAAAEQWSRLYGLTVYAVSHTEQSQERSIALGHGDIRLIVTQALVEDHPATSYVDLHGEGVADIALRTTDATRAFEVAVARGARPVSPPTTRDGVVTATIVGFGDVMHTFVERSTEDSRLPGFRAVPHDSTDGPNLYTMDHFAVCLEEGQLDPTVEFYQDVLGFEMVFRERIIVGPQAMDSKVVRSHSGKVTWQGGNRGSSWTGNATFPAELRLVNAPDGPSVARTPVTELDSLRADSKSWRNETVNSADGRNLFAGILADTYEITARFDLQGATATQFGFALHSRSDGTADRSVVYDRKAGTLYGKALAPTDNEISMRLLVDRGQLEIFSGDGLFSVADNVNFDSAAVSQGIRLFATGGDVRLKSATFARLSTSWGTAQPTLESTLAGPWHASGGSWTDTSGGKQGQATGDAFYLSASSAGDTVWLGTAQAAGLTFRATGYTANIDTNGVVKLWRPDRDIATYSTPIAAGSTHHLKVETTGDRIRVWLNHGTTPVIDATDTAYTSGLFGANVYHGSATVQNLNTGSGGFTAFSSGPWTTRGGTWTTIPDALHASSSGDGFYLSDRTGTDFGYEGDVSVTNGTATGLTFRASADGAGYTANIDTNGVVELWRPGRDIATYSTPIAAGSTYHLKVQTTGDRIRVWLDHGTTPVIDATDSTYGTGRFGVNAYAGNTTAQNLTITRRVELSLAAGPVQPLCGLRKAAICCVVWDRDHGQARRALHDSRRRHQGVQPVHHSAEAARRQERRLLGVAGRIRSVRDPMGEVYSRGPRRRCASADSRSALQNPARRAAADRAGACP
ncbi:GH32 C-terminal domain-containing protein [Kibdelosporangium aridum]|uniref:4-hydroxyphenylpyruvate dioxygenase n=1 Tax=Kibdelosporangium aridum TaxID=2030 RepID=A0A1W2FYT2_KIBAR|nr:GH32 C-terminal domain-containing protein [Kibdelosporangium aridum]SMD27117.1 4-hydroxyphenylpyruvate dioxygenase [Kibdelosporangium aridum]